MKTSAIDKISKRRFHVADMVSKHTLIHLMIRVLLLTSTVAVRVNFV